MTHANTFPKRFNFNEVQKRWIEFWKEENIFKFDFNNIQKLLTIDTPPPFVSGTLHM
ncbi:MAG: hypothetical protein MUP85_25835 [Candidatus Lokiarchaeota archaeon]|nr:hypothetical protein [Candidatus Lokiarchaeota archaeon]